MKLIVENLGWVFICFAGLVFVTPYLFTHFQLFECVGYGEKPSEIGDTIGGIAAPFINLFAGFLVYLALKEQIKANKIQLNSLATFKEEKENDDKFQLALSELNWCADQYAKIQFNGIIGVNSIDEVMKSDTDLDYNIYTDDDREYHFQNISTLSSYLSKLITIIESVESKQHQAVLANKALFIYRSYTKKYKSKIDEYIDDFQSLLRKNNEEEVFVLINIDEDQYDFLVNKSSNIRPGVFDK